MPLGLLSLRLRAHSKEQDGNDYLKDLTAPESSSSMIQKQWKKQEKFVRVKFDYISHMDAIIEK